MFPQAIGEWEMMATGYGSSQKGIYPVWRKRPLVPKISKRPLTFRRRQAR